MSMSERFWAKVDKTGDCWVWTGALHWDGYGAFSVGGAARSARAHRCSWEMENGPIEPGKCVLHRCDNRKCVNPAHLFLGSRKDNTQDMRSKGRTARGERHGNAKLTAADVLLIREAHETLPEATIDGIARGWGVSSSHVYAIVRREKWAHV